MTTPAPTMSFDDIVARPGTIGELPLAVSGVLVQAAMRQSTALKLGLQMPVSTRYNKVPVLTDHADAYWVGTPDIGLKQTTSIGLGMDDLVVEELAAILPVPQAVVDDCTENGFPLLDYIRPELVRAMSVKLDDAVLWGQPGTRPDSLGVPVVQHATDAGNVVPEDPADLALSLFDAATRVSTQGYNVTGAALGPGYQWIAAKQRTTQFQANPVGASSPFVSTLGGMQLAVDPLRWPLPPNGPVAIVGQWDCLKIGMRQQLTIEMSTETMITDETGKVVLNLFQQDAVAFRTVMRVGWYLANPIADELITGDRSPFCLVSAAGSNGGNGGNGDAGIATQSMSISATRASTKAAPKRNA